MKNNARGFLLVEAIIAIGLLALGVAAASEAFLQARRAVDRGSSLAELSECAQTTLALASPDCDRRFNWRLEARALSPRIESAVWTAAWEENGNTHEQTFETVRRARI